METIFTVLAAGILGALLYIIFNLKSQTNGQADNRLLVDLMQGLRQDIANSSGRNRQELQNRLDNINDLLQKHQIHANKSIQKQFGESQQVIKAVVEKLTKIESTNKQVLGFTEQIKSLENILKNPKQRGILGEYMLETLLSNVLQPKQYKMQYAFKNGEIVDSVIFFNKKIIPIDAKFSLEKYNLMIEATNKAEREKLSKAFKSDIKKRIDETSKYIRPTEDTTEFAFMFIPAEGIYYNLLAYNVGSSTIQSQDLVEYAFRKRVIITSPTSFFAYLKTVLQGLKALKMEDSVRDVIKKVETLGRHLNSYEENMTKVGKHLTTTMNMYNHASREFTKIDKDIYQITDGKEGKKTTPNLIEVPAAEKLTSQND